MTSKAYRTFRNLAIAKRGAASNRKLLFLALGIVFMPVVAHAQVPDLENDLDAGGRAMGMGGSTYATGSETLSSYYNPAGLGDLHRAQVGISMRNLPKSTSFVSGDLAGEPNFSTTNNVGPNSITHAGIAIPIKSRKGKNDGTFAISFTTGGIDQDQRFGTPFTTFNGESVPNYYQTLFNRNDFLSFAYGKSNASQTFNWGVALLYAMNHQSDTLSGLPYGNGSFASNAHGWGGLFGIQYAPSRNTEVGISYRTQIDLSGNQPLQYTTIPARLSTGLAYRMDFGPHFLVLGAQINDYFQGSRSNYFDSPDQTTLGAGAEYNLNVGPGFVPLRMGYDYQFESSTYDFDARNTFTYGLGYRPANGDWGLDFNFATAAKVNDFGLNLFYRFGR